MGEMKTCTRCGDVKDITEYSRCAGVKSGLRAQCRACRKIVMDEYYRTNTEVHRKRNKIAKALRRAEALRVQGGSCVECGSVEQLELDHINGDGRDHRLQESNTKYVGRIALTGTPDPRLQVLCAPCHKPKSASENGAAHRRVSV